MVVIRIAGLVLQARPVKIALMVVCVHARMSLASSSGEYKWRSGGGLGVGGAMSHLLPLHSQQLLFVVVVGLEGGGGSPCKPDPTTSSVDHFWYQHTVTCTWFVQESMWRRR